MSVSEDAGVHGGALLVRCTTAWSLEPQEGTGPDMFTE
jgi:hypothetical protein